MSTFRRAAEGPWVLTTTAQPKLAGIRARSARAPPRRLPPQSRPRTHAPTNRTDTDASGRVSTPVGRTAPTRRPQPDQPAGRARGPSGRPGVVADASRRSRPRRPGTKTDRLHRTPDRVRHPPRTSIRPKDRDLATMLKRQFDPSRPHRYVRYGRVSTEMQNPRSPEQQFDTIDMTLRRLGYTWTHAVDYRDDAVSGRLVAKRPGFQKMLSDLRSGSVEADLILVDSFERFGRADEIGAIRQQLQSRDKILVLTADSQFTDPTSIAGRALTMIENIRATEDGRIKAHNVLRGKRDLASRGRWPGGPVPLEFRLRSVLIGRGSPADRPRAERRPRHPRPGQADLRGDRPPLPQEYALHRDLDLRQALHRDRSTIDTSASGSSPARSPSSRGFARRSCRMRTSSRSRDSVGRGPNPAPGSRPAPRGRGPTGRSGQTPRRGNIS